MEYTIEVYRTDLRTKKGERRVDTLDVTVNSPKTAVEAHYKAVFKGHRIAVYETYVTRTNLMGGAEYTERYDTPRYCSPSSEAYWSM
jgi:tRNA A58 N-methylase Trm61